MKRLSVLFLSLLLLAGVFSCTPRIVREKATYKVELEFFRQVAVQTADALDGFVQSTCQCSSDGNFTSLECSNAARKVLLIRARIDWHTNMALWNAGLLDERPPVDPPTIPGTQTLCPKTDDPEIPEIPEVENGGN